MSEYLIYEHDAALSPDYDLYVEGAVPVRDIQTLWLTIKTLQERGYVVLIKAMSEGDDDDGQRLVFSTHPDTIETRGSDE